MHVELLLEEPSAEIALCRLIPKIAGQKVSINPIVFQGKPDLLDKLEPRLKAYRSWIPDDFRIVVLIDEDRENCRALKSRMERSALRAGLITKSRAAPGTRFHVLNRIAVEELEAWFLGDVHAIAQAFARVPVTLGQRSRFRNPDAVQGGTWEALERAFQQYGHFPGGLQKTEAAARISVFMDPDRNRSRSFQVFRDGLRTLIAQ